MGCRACVRPGSRKCSDRHSASAATRRSWRRSSIWPVTDDTTREVEDLAYHPVSGGRTAAQIAEAYAETRQSEFEFFERYPVDLGWLDQYAWAIPFAIAAAPAAFGGLAAGGITAVEGGALSGDILAPELGL